MLPQRGGVGERAGRNGKVGSAMGQYAGFIWGAYGVTALALLGMGLLTWRRLRATEATLRSLEAVRRGRRQALAGGSADDA